MTIRILTCAEADEFFDSTGIRYEGWHVHAALTDQYGTYGEPTIMTLWGKGGVQIRTTRYPDPHNPGGPDEYPCEHRYYDGGDLNP